MREQPSVMRVVDRFVDHGAPISFRELCARVVEEGYDYLLLDLDKTTHLGRNMGELLAWELCAYEAYGESDAGRRLFDGRLLVDWSRPMKTSLLDRASPGRHSGPQSLSMTICTPWKI